MATNKSLTATVVPVRLASGKTSSAIRYRNLTPTANSGTPAAGPTSAPADLTGSALGVKPAVPAVVEKPLKEQLYEALGLSEDDFEAEFVIGSQDSAVITATSAEMRVRGGGIGSSAWLAKVVGADAEYGINREFVRAERSLSGSGRSGSISWALDGDGIYEYRGWAESSQRSASGFCAVLNGRVASLGNRKAGVAKAAAILDKGAIL